MCDRMHLAHRLMALEHGNASLSRAGLQFEDNPARILRRYDESWQCLKGLRNAPLLNLL